MEKSERLIKDENEAIETIKRNMPTSGYYMLREALEMAIKALEEVQEYRKIGTPSEIRESMESTLSEIISIRKSLQKITGGRF